MDFLEFLYENILYFFQEPGAWRMPVMWIIGGLLIFLAIKKEMEPTLLLPMGFGAILVNLPFADAITEHGAITTLYNAGIANELFPLLLFIGIGAMIDFGPLLSNPKLMIFGAAAQFGIFFTLCLASMFLTSTMQHLSLSSVRLTVLPRSPFRKDCNPSIPVQLW